MHKIDTLGQAWDENGRRWGFRVDGAPGLGGELCCRGEPVIACDTDKMEG